MRNMKDDRDYTAEMTMEDSHRALEQSIEQLDAHRTQDNMWNLVEEIRRCVNAHEQFLVPLLSQPMEDLMDIPKLNLDLMEMPDGHLFRKVEMEKGGMAYCAFTSQEEMEKGELSESELIDLDRLLHTVLFEDDIMGLILNPWGTSVLLDRELITVILDESHTSPGSESSSLYIDRGETCDQNADVLVSAAVHPFSFDEPCSAAMLKKSEGELENVCADLSAPKAGMIVSSSAPNLTASMVFHAALPEHAREADLSALISALLDRAASLGMRSIVLPAIGSEEAPLHEEIPFPVIAAAGWLNAHPHIRLDVTITCRLKETYDTFYRYLFE